MANITVTSSTSNVNVNSTTNQVNVSTTTSNVVVGAATSFNIDETLVNLGSVSGNITLDLSLGRTFTGTQTGNVTFIDVTNLEEGMSATLLLKQGSGGHFLDTTTYATAWESNWDFANDFTDFARNAFNWNVISFFYDGSIRYASLVVSNSLGITNADLANSNVIVNGTTIELGSSGNISNFGTLTTDDLTQGSTNNYFLATANNTTTGTITAGAFLGDGSGLSNVSQLTNAQAQAYIEQNGLALTANVTSNSLISTTNSIVTEDITILGNITSGSLSNTIGTYLANTAAALSSKTNVALTPTSSIGAGNVNVFKIANDTTDFMTVGNGGLHLTSNSYEQQVNISERIKMYANAASEYGYISGGAGFLGFQVHTAGVGATHFDFMEFDGFNMSSANIVLHRNLKSNSSIQANGTITAGTSATDTHTFTGNVDVTGNLEVSGNLNYRNVEDLYVRDQTITLNANAATDATVDIISNRPQSTYDAKLTWNEPSEVWTFMNGDNTFHEMLTSTQARGLVSVGSSATPSGNGSLAYNSTTGVFTLTPADTSLATKSTSDLAEGTNLYYTDARVVTAVGSLTSNVITTANVSAEYVIANTAVSSKLLRSTTPTVNGGGVNTPIIRLNTVSRETGGGSSAFIEALGDESNTSVLPRIKIQSAQQYQSQDSVQITDNLEVTGNIYNSGGNITLPGGVVLRGSTGSTSTVNELTAGNVTATAFIGDGSQLTNLPTQGDITEVIAGVGLGGGGTTGAVTLNLDPTITTATASGNGGLAYDNTSGVFTFTPADLTGTSLTNAQAQSFIQSSGLTMTSAITSNSLISTTGNVQINPDTEIDGMKGLTYDSTNNFLGLGTTTPEAAFHQISDNNGFSATVLLTEYSTGSTAGDFRFQRGEGTLANPSVMNSSDRIGQIRWEPIFSKAAGNISYGYEYNTTVEMSGFADGTQGGTTTITDISLIGSRSGSTDTHTVQNVQAYNGGTLTADSITFAGGQIFSDGVVVDYSGATDTNVTPLNGLAFYVKYNAADGGRYELFDDAGYTTPSQRVLGSSSYSSGVGDIGVKADRLEFTDRTLNYSDGRIFTFSGATDSNVTPLNGQVAYVDRTGGSTSRRYELYRDEARIDPWNLQGTLNVTGLQVETSDFYQPTGIQIQLNNTQESQTSLTKIRANGTMEFGATSFQAGTGAAASITKDGIFTTAGNITSSGNVAGNYFIGNGSLLTGVTSSLDANITVDQINFPVASTANTKPSIKTTHDNANSIDISGVKNIYGVDRNNGYEYDDVRVVVGPTKRFQVNQTTNANAQLETNLLTVETDGTLYVDGGNITASSNENITLDSGTQNVKISKTLAGTKYDQLTFNNQGWAPTSYKTNPVYNGTAERVAYVMEGTTTAGSNVLTVTTAAEFQDAFGTGSFSGNAPTAGGRTAMFTGTNAIATNYIGRARGTLTSGSFPFPPGIRIQSIDTVNFTITMDRPAEETATLSWNGGGSDTDVFLIAAGAYGFSTTEGYSETYFSSYDFQQLGSGSTSKVTLAFSELSNQDAYGFGKTGPTWSIGVADIGTSIGATTDYTAPTYNTRGKVALEGETTFINSNYGLTVGANASLSNRINNDPFTGFGYNQLWDGTEDYNTDFGFTGAIPQIGTKQYTDGSLQSTTPYIGTRLQFNSAYGQITDNPTQWYPRTGQELGRLGWWGSHGNLENPSSLAAPAYISVQAADNWTEGSNASMYFVATSDYSKTYREPFISYEKGNLILAGGNVAGVTQNITFAPAKRAQGSGANPAGTYNFVGGPTSTAAFGTINYANTSANSGSKFSVNNGGSLGAGTVGDMQVSLHRKDNTYTANAAVTSITAFWPAAAAGTAADVVQVNSGSGALPRGVDVTFSGVTTSGWTFLNGNTYVLTDPGYGDTFSTLTQSGTNVTQASGVAVAGSGQYEYVSSAASGVTDKEWSLTLAEQSENLNIQTGIAGAITQIIPHKNQGTSPWTGLADSIAISGLSGTTYNGTEVTISGITDSGATEVNGNTYYLKWDSAQTVYGLYTDTGLLTPVQVMTGTGFIGSPGGTPTATYDGSSVTFTDARTEFGSSLHLMDYTTTEINALASPQAGDTVFNTTENTICFYNGTNWQKVTSANL